MMRGMSDRSVELSVGALVASGLWILSVFLLAVSWALPDGGRGGQAAMLAGGAACTATVRVYFVRTNRLLRNLLHIEPTSSAALSVVREREG